MRESLMKEEIKLREVNQWKWKKVTNKNEYQQEAEKNTKKTIKKYI